jgi:hypothetical protein
VKSDVKAGAEKAAVRAKEDTAKVKAAAKETAAVAASKAKETGVCVCGEWGGGGVEGGGWRGKGGRGGGGGGEWSGEMVGKGVRCSSQGDRWVEGQENVCFECRESRVSCGWGGGGFGY